MAYNNILLQSRRSAMEQTENIRLFSGCFQEEIRAGVTLLLITLFRIHSMIWLVLEEQCH